MLKVKSPLSLSLSLFPLISSFNSPSTGKFRTYGNTTETSRKIVAHGVTALHLLRKRTHYDHDKKTMEADGRRQAPPAKAESGADSWCSPAVCPSSEIRRKLHTDRSCFTTCIAKTTHELGSSTSYKAPPPHRFRAILTLFRQRS